MTTPQITRIGVDRNTRQVVIYRDTYTGPDQIRYRLADAREHIKFWSESVGLYGVLTGNELRRFKAATTRLAKLMESEH